MDPRFGKVPVQSGHESSKTHYPVEFMAALLSSEVSKPENVVKYIKECREMGIAVEPPDPKA